MARIDKYDPISGGFRAPILAAIAAAHDGAVGESDAPIAVGLDTSGRVVPGAGNTGVKGVLCLSSKAAAGDVVDTMTDGEIVEFGGTAGTNYYADRTTGVISATNTTDVNEVQTLTRTSTGGTITLTFDDETTATIPATAAGFTAAAVQAALLALPNLAPGDVAVTGSDGGPLTVTFSGTAFGGQNVPLLVVDNTLATGGTIVAALGTGGAGSIYIGHTVEAGRLIVRMERGV